MILVDAHAIFKNGAVFSRAGTAMVAMMAKERNIPFLVCCETYKFSNSVLIDALEEGELGENSTAYLCLPPSPPTTPFKIISGSLGRKISPSRQQSFKMANIEHLHPEYDLTPPTYVTAIATEAGIIHPNAVVSIFL